MRRVRRRLVTWLLSITAVYALLVVAFAALQDQLVFPGAGRGDRGVPALAGLAVETIARRDGGRSRIVTVRGGDVRAVALYFVGNGEDLHSAARGAIELARFGLEVIGVEHPGYGASDGPPSVASLLANAEAAAAVGRERARARAVPLVVVGSSLGSFCAVHVAAQGEVGRLLLRAPPTSLAAVAKQRFWWLPVDWLLRHPFDSTDAAPRVTCPVLVLHGDRDAIVPLRLGAELCESFGGRAELVVAEGFGHNDLPLQPDGPFGPRIGAFLLAR
jgi:pimeloyl-ACP methyl ester carboxylesterase